MKINIPPIKSQGIKTKLIPWISGILPDDHDGRWIEPFMGTGVVAFNLAPRRALLCDTNPHLINFYQAILDGEITADSVRRFLEKEGAYLAEKGESHYYRIRERFNKKYAPLDFLFLNRAGFNGMIRFNGRGELNVPFCRKPQRFARAYVTKIVNQVSYVAYLLRRKNFVFKCQSFQETVKSGRAGDMIYCDPPYIDRHVDYYNGWREEHERALFELLLSSESKFILSTWHHNDFRHNRYIELLWSAFNILTQEHFYHVGANEKNRNAMVEAIVTNYDVSAYEREIPEKHEQLALLEKQMPYKTWGI